MIRAWPDNAEIISAEPRGLVRAPEGVLDRSPFITPLRGRNRNNLQGVLWGLDTVAVSCCSKR